MADYIPSTSDWVREQVELYEGSGGKEGTTLRDTGMPVVVVTNRGNQTGAIRKTPLMRVKDGNNYVLVGSRGGAPKNPVWVYNLRADGNVEVQDEAEKYTMRVREVEDDEERARLWDLAVAAYPPYEEYQTRTTRKIPVFCSRAGVTGGVFPIRRIRRCQRLCSEQNTELRHNHAGDSYDLTPGTRTKFGCHVSPVAFPGSQWDLETISKVQGNSICTANTQVPHPCLSRRSGNPRARS